MKKIIFVLFIFCVGTAAKAQYLQNGVGLDVRDGWTVGVWVLNVKRNSLEYRAREAVYGVPGREADYATVLDHFNGKSAIYIPRNTKVLRVATNEPLSFFVWE